MAFWNILGNGGIPTPVELRDLLVILLTDAAGGIPTEWRAAIGVVEKLPTWANWAIHPKGSAKQLDAVKKAVELVRLAHPHVVR